MPFEWDDQKRVANLEKHGIDFKFARLIFDGPTLEGPDNRHDYGERRIGAYGVANGEALFVIYTWRGDSRRLSSARKAGTHEREAYLSRITIEGADNEG